VRTAGPAHLQQGSLSLWLWLIRPGSYSLMVMNDIYQEHPTGPTEIPVLSAMALLMTVDNYRNLSHGSAPITQCLLHIGSIH
jgi:hypothetical protein